MMMRYLKEESVSCTSDGLNGGLFTFPVNSPVNMKKAGGSRKRVRQGDERERERERTNHVSGYVNSCRRDGR